YRTDKADAAHVGMANQRGSDLAVTRDDIDDARGENSFTEFAETQARERRLFGALDHDAVAGGEWRGGLLGAKPKWMIERIDLRHHAERLAPRQVEMARALRGGLALDFGDEPGAIAQPVRRPDHVAAHADDGISRVHRVEQRQLVGVLFDAIRQQLEAPRAFLGRNSRPFLEARFRGLYREVDVGLARGRNVAELLHVRWIDRRGVLVFDRRNPAAADEQPVRSEIERRRLHVSTLVARNDRGAEHGSLRRLFEG